MNHNVIPLKNQVPCHYCGETINSDAPGIYHRGTAWFRQQPNVKNRKGGNSAALVEWEGSYACRFCIGKLQDGISLHQLELFHLPYSDD